MGVGPSKEYASGDSSAKDEAQRKQAEEEAVAAGRRLSTGDRVSLGQRVWPLVDMMKRAHAADEEIVWGV